MKSLSGKRILLGVTGGIAAYKSAELVRKLRAEGASVRVIMTQAATEFITPLTLQTLSGEPVWSDWSDESSEIGHIELARWADRVLIAPATADTLARLAQGRADDLLTAICLATTSPLCVAPAMNQAMWQHPATVSNLDLLRQRGVQVAGPAEGEQACGEVGPGRMLEPEALVQQISDSFVHTGLSGLKVVITAGPTREPIDPVRFLSNRSSGKMGYAVARAAAEAGAAVTLVSGPVSLHSPDHVRRIEVETAQQMLDAVMGQIDDCDLFIGVAAVADYAPQIQATEKIKKQSNRQSLPLEPTVDILAAVSALRKRPFCVGFAAETQNLESFAQKKRLSKGVELIVANQVGHGQGFDSDENELLLVWEGGKRKFEKDSKQKLATLLIQKIADLYTNQTGTKSHAEHSA